MPQQAPLNVPPGAPHPGITTSVPRGIPSPDQPSFDRVTLPVGPPMAKAAPRILSFTVADADAGKHLLQNYALGSSFFVAPYTTSPGRIYYRCSKGGKYEPKGHDIRHTHTSKTQCPFKAVLNRPSHHNPSTPFSVEILEPSHNHESFVKSSAHPSTRKLTADEDEFIWNLKQCNLTNNQILTALKSQFPGWGSDPAPFQNVKQYDIKNAIARMQEDLLGGLTATQALLDGLEEAGYWYECQMDGLGRLQYLSWSFNWSIEMWKAFPRLIFVDCTHDVSLHLCTG